jgi:sugar phosphate isomerase/epimerase
MNEIVCYTDTESKNIADQIKLAKTLDISNLAIRYFSDSEKVLELDKVRAKELCSLLKKEKMNFVIFDPLMKSYTLSEIDEDFDEYLLDILSKAKDLNAKYVNILMPKYEKNVENIELLNSFFNKVSLLNKKYNNNIVYSISTNSDPSLIATTLDKFKKLQGNIHFIFDPEIIKKNGLSNITTYRFLRDYILFFKCVDSDLDGTPKIIKTGKLDISALFNKLQRDSYQNYFLFENNFIVNKDILDDNNKVSFKQKVLGIFNKAIRKENKTQSKMISGATSNMEELTEEKILLKQIEELKKVFSSIK